MHIKGMTKHSHKYCKLKYRPSPSDEFIFWMVSFTIEL